MKGHSILLVGTPSQSTILEAIAATLPVAAVLNPSRRRMPPLKTLVIASSGEGLALKPSVVCLLTPFARMDQFIIEAAMGGAHILTAGPIDLSRRNRQAIEEALGGTPERRLTQANGLLASRLHQSLRVQRDRDEFGRPVYLRTVGGGGAEGLTAAWWRLWQTLEQALNLLDSRIGKLTVVANRAGRKLNATLSVTVESQASALVSVLPFDVGSGPDILLLGTGGTVSSQTHFNAVPMFSAGKKPNLLFDCSAYAEPEMIAGYLRQLDGISQLPGFTSALDPSPLSSHLLRGLRTALRTKRITEIQLQK